MELAARILQLFCRAPDASHSSPGDRNPLATFEREYPDFGAFIRGKDVLDFGCGWGHQARAMVERYGARVVGLDTSPPALETAIAHAGALVRFTDRLLPEDRFDVIVSQDAMEHFPDPVKVIDTMISALRPGGHLLITFGPPWLAPYGSHMQFFCPIPWLNVLFPERAVMRVRARYRNDGATRYEEAECGLNKMTLRKFRRIVRHSGLTVERCQFRCIRGITLLARIPLLREFTVNHVTVVLRKT